VQPDVVEGPKLCVIDRVRYALLIFLLDADDLLVWVCASEQKAVALIKSKEVNRLQGVNHSVHTSAIHDTSLLT